MRVKGQVKGRTLLAWVFSAAFILGACALPLAGSEAQKSPASTRFEEAQKLLRQRNPDAALAEAEAGLRLDPRSVEGLDLVGIIYVQKQDYARAIETFERALKIDPRSARTLNSLGNTYLAQGKRELAEKEFREALRFHPADHDANYNLGLVLLSRKEARQAIVYFSRVRPQDSEVLTNLAQAYFAAGQKAKGLEVAKSLSERGKNEVRTHFTLGILLAGQKLYPEAVHEFQLADALKPGTFEILHNLGEAWLKAGSAAQAEEVLERARRLNPGSADTLYLLAQSAADQGKNVQALELLVEARKLAPENTDIIFLLARMSMLLDYFEDAIQVLEEGVRIAPRRVDLHAALGESYFTVGKLDRAQQEFKTLIELDPSARSYAFMGLSYRHRGQFDEAKKYFLEGLQKDPRNAQCLFNLGFIGHKQGNYALAEKYLAGALASHPDYNDALYEMAGVKMSEKKYAEAIPLLRRAARLLPQPAEAYYKLATAERNLHQTEVAQRDMKVFETLSKDPKSAPYPLQHLYEFVGRRAELPPQARAELDLNELQTEAQRHTGRPNTLYLLAEAYFKRGRNEEALQSVEQLDRVSGGDARTAIGVGVLLARFGQHAQAIQHFQTALAADPSSDEARYNLANTFFQVGEYQKALELLQSVSPDAQKDDAYLLLLGDTYTHLGRTADAIPVLQMAVLNSPDNDPYYLSLALAQVRAGNWEAASRVLREGLARVPDSGQLYWGMGVVSVLRGDSERAETYLKKAIDLMPSRESAYGTLGIFYYEAGRFSEARETLQRYSALFPKGRFDVSRIREALSRALASGSSARAMASLPPQARNEFLQLALAVAEAER
ncbi:MAG: tetratricopeptide repeat protein [Acidobacteriia bacterium]|nr:tetratricopeptide repeat protein [Terriglobia bacterium]